MIWRDILVERDLSTAEIESVVGRILKLPAKKIIAVTEFEDFPTAGSKLVVCHKTSFKNGFRSLLSFYLFDDAYMNELNVDDFAASLSKLSKSRCLVPADSHNPYQVHLYDLHNSGKLVNIDVDQFDDNEEYYIDGEVGKT